MHCHGEVDNIFFAKWGCFSINLPLNWSNRDITLTWESFPLFQVKIIPWKSQNIVVITVSADWTIFCLFQSMFTRRNPLILLPIHIWRVRKCHLFQWLHKGTKTHWIVLEHYKTLDLKNGHTIWFWSTVSKHCTHLADNFLIQKCSY